MNSYSIVVIGGGAAGMIAARQASSGLANTLLVEKNPKLGIKILISGGGKCNITHGGDMETMRKQFRINESRFLNYSFRSFTNSNILELLNEQGVQTYERDNGKVFPVSHKAGDVVHALRRLVETAGAEIRIATPVHTIERQPSGNFLITAGSDMIEAAKVIIACGGSSYTKTGTTGDGYLWTSHLGHTIVPLRPALAPIFLLPVPPSDWQGTPIRDCLLKAISNDTVISSWRGDMLFTHVGVSGPAVLEISRDASLEIEKGNSVTLAVDFIPDRTLEELEKTLMNEISRNVNRNLLSLVEYYVPQKLASHLAQQAMLDPSKKLHQLTKQERRSLSQRLKNCAFGIVKEIPLDRGEVTAGGVDLREIDPTSMESKLVPGLYFCGEILDIAGPVGGYNLQAAFSTGFVAGRHAAQSLR